MTGHRLGDPYRIYNSARTLYVLAADCGCGLTLYGTSLWREVWPQHTIHLAHVAEMSRRRHPSSREES